MTENREPGFYTDTTNGDLWRLDIFDSREAWHWINGNHWTHVPKMLVPIVIGAA